MLFSLCLKIVNRGRRNKAWELDRFAWSFLWYAAVETIVYLGEQILHWILSELVDSYQAPDSNGIPGNRLTVDSDGKKKLLP